LGLNIMTNEHVRQAILQQAAEWYAAHRAGVLSDAQEAEFLAWLKSSPQHIEEYFGVHAAATMLTSHAQMMDESAAALVVQAESIEIDNVVPLPHSDATSASHAVIPRSRSIAAIAACAAFFTLAFAAFAFRDTLLFGRGQTYRTVQGQQATWRLPDGSVLHLNTHSTVTVRMTDAERLLTVHEGQALFQVAQDPARRFRVTAGEANIVAIGTQFDVRRDPGAARVTIIEGRVAVTKGAAPPLESPMTELPGAVALSAGEQLEIDAQGVSEPRKVDIHRVSAWIKGQIILDATPLSEIVAELNRYSAVPLEIADPQLRDLELSGVFDAYDVESFLEFMRRLEDVSVEETPARILLRHRAIAAPTPAAVTTQH
jgi:transmembrane sensor